VPASPRRGCPFHRHTALAHVDAPGLSLPSTDRACPLPVPSCTAYILEDLRQAETDRSGGNILSMTRVLQLGITISPPQAQSDSSSLPHDQSSFSVAPSPPSLAMINGPATYPPFEATILPIPHHHHPCRRTLHFYRGCKAFQTLLCCHSMFLFTLTTNLFNSQCPIIIPGALMGRPVKGVIPKVLFGSALCS